MVFNATFNNISVILWRSVLLVEETGEKTTDHKNPLQYYIYVVDSFIYNKTCIKRSLLGQRKSGVLKQVTS